MKIKEFYFDLPQKLIAQLPSDKRGDDKLLIIKRESGEIIHTDMKNLINYIPKNSLICFNNTKVRKARLFAKSETGAKVEFLFTDRKDKDTFLAIVSKSKKQKLNKTYTFDDLTKCMIIGEEDDQKVVKFDKNIDEDFFEKLGHMPLPPYIKRDDLDFDAKRYQTIYAKSIGSVASPTAGLHFTKELMDELKKNNDLCEITLHVGLGTFLPVREENLEDHKMHYENYFISKEAANLINDALKTKRNIVAIGTTSVRSLESAYDEESKSIKAGYNSTNLFIKPGYDFKVVNNIFTNFHTPESTLLVLISTFATKELIFKAYNQAIEKEYMFFSYGDATFII